MKNLLMKVSACFVLSLLFIPFAAVAQGSGDQDDAPLTWQKPPEDILKVLNAPQLPWVWTSPTGIHLLMADPILYPKLEELAAPMHKLAGMRVNPANNSYQGQHGGTAPRLLQIGDQEARPLGLPDEAEVLTVAWTANGQRFALTVQYTDHIGLWTGSVDGQAAEVEGVMLNPLMDNAVTWLPDQERLLLRRIPDRGPAPPPPPIPAGPEIMEGSGASATRSSCGVWASA